MSPQALAYKKSGKICEDDMSFISYGQNFEDVMLWRALKHVEKGFYIDIGAAWPDVCSVTKSFYDRNWSGINVEPHPMFFPAFKKIGCGILI